MDHNDESKYSQESRKREIIKQWDSTTSALSAWQTECWRKPVLALSTLSQLKAVWVWWQKRISPQTRQREPWKGCGSKEAETVRRAWEKGAWWESQCAPSGTFCQRIGSIFIFRVWSQRQRDIMAPKKEKKGRKERETLREGQRERDYMFNFLSVRSRILVGGGSRGRAVDLYSSAVVQTIFT